MSSSLPTGKNTQEKNRKTPYQMRFDLLCLAKDIVEQDIHLKLEQKRRAMELNKNTPLDDQIIGFTTEDVIAEAHKLNEFISNKA